jgi:hypothetical protein
MHIDRRVTAMLRERLPPDSWRLVERKDHALLYVDGFDPVLVGNNHGPGSARRIDTTLRVVDKITRNFHKRRHP